MSPSTIRFDHLERLTDDTGLLEHCLGRIPRRREGYATDDNARAIWLCVEWLAQLPADAARERRLLYRLLDKYLAFLLWAQQENGWFQNNIRFDRTPEPEGPSDDCLGRSLWAAAVACVHLSDEARRQVAAEILRRALPAASGLRHPRGLAWALATCCLLGAHNRRGRTNSAAKPAAKDAVNPGHTAEDGASLAAFDLLKYTGPFRRQDGLDLNEGTLSEQAADLEQRLLTLYEVHSDAAWHWFEPHLTYANGLIPWALWLSWRVYGRAEARRVAEESLSFLVAKMTGKDGCLRPIGNRGWCTREWQAEWDQQPIDVMKLALAAREAYLATGDARWREVVQRALNWFHGANDLQLPLADPSDGSCCDGLSPTGANPNRGAESTLSYLFTQAFAVSLRLVRIDSEAVVYPRGAAAGV
ncbi:hypothetical protein [Alicyclobacillus herbarius]|uniref:hypothetical protein n=1 Tax=Alicyclobacillus herbarius TaxID=122960 RepID=UPI00040C7088|nr:hypothetical protein [Alicyclobacillus herbarius]